jgi:hypothetical protein
MCSFSVQGKNVKYREYGASCRESKRRGPAVLWAVVFFGSYTVKKLCDILVPSRDVTYQTLPGRE